MAGLDPAIHVFGPPKENKTWITATSAVMTAVCRGSWIASLTLAMTRGLKMPDGQSAHARYVRIARRANPPQPDGVAGYPKSVVYPAVPRSIRGALRDRHECRARDAMDALTLPDERCRCGRRSRVVLAPLGWRKVGDDALHRADDGDSDVMDTGESAKETVKPSRGECR